MSSLRNASETDGSDLGHVHAETQFSRSPLYLENAPNFLDSWISEKFNLNETIAVYGKIEFYNGFRLIHPEFDMLDDNEDPINTGKIISIYPSNTDLKSVGIDSRGFRRLLNSAIEKSKSSISDFYSSKVLKSNGLINLK